MSISGDSFSISSVQVSHVQEHDQEEQVQGSKTFEDALVQPESGGGSSSITPSGKQVASYSMALGRNLLGVGAGLASGIYVATEGLKATLVTTATVKTVDKLIGSDKIDTVDLAMTGVDLSMKAGIGVGMGVGSTVISLLSPYESNPDTLLSDKERVGTLSKMFDDVQSNKGVSTQHKDAIKLMDDLGDKAYRRTGTDENGKPTYTKMSKEEYRAALLHGAHVVVKGTGTLDAFKGIDGLEMVDRSGKGKSSHYTTMDEGIDREQYGIDLPMSDVGGDGNGFGHLLAGKTSHGDTFFQLEGHGTKTWGQWLKHAGDLFTHLNSLANVGPQGVIDMVEGSQTHIVINPD
ncbi:hypothetical protein [Parachitinimonas caeni]|uniref:Uncharacterized protein n=1 Tax=Parachitinimonas caeni TaxID=3031301 RepID=A0ABT7E164_9NEIS|nr:hypothetical protein [Parachitinimonas caeni]MDK2125784.1 hypothetical protein [Parachitinimonas caeni]